jgi:hypothetical protein
MTAKTTPTPMERVAILDARATNGLASTKTLGAIAQGSTGQTSTTAPTKQVS